MSPPPCCGRRPRRRQIDELVLDDDNPTTLVGLPHTTLPENMGLIVRLCAAFGVNAVLSGERSVDPFYRRAVRVSMGSVFRLPVFEPGRFEETIQFLKKRGFDIVAVETASHSVPLESVCRRQSRTCLVFGNEESGIPAEILPICDRAVEIPMSPGVDSLNVATATAIFLHFYTRVLNG